MGDRPLHSRHPADGIKMGLDAGLAGMAGDDPYLWTPRHGHAVPVIDRHAHHRAPYISYGPPHAHSRDNSDTGYCDLDPVTHGHPDPIAYGDTVSDRIATCRNDARRNNARRNNAYHHRFSDDHGHSAIARRREP